jgi:ABC-type transport system involved in multi-copper enzyme maturation permease subunit
MTWLVWKDFRLSRLVFIVAVVLFALPYAIPATVNWYQTGSFIPVVEGDTRKGLIVSSLWSLILLQLAVAFMGGSAFAGERMDRSAEFLACLPVSRGRIVASKLLVVLGLVAMIWIPNLVILSIAASSVQLTDTRFLVTCGLIATTGLTFFCVAWLFSAILQSPAFSVCFGLLPPIIAGMAFAITMDVKFHGDAPPQVLLWYHNLYHAICLSLSAVSFAGGTFYYLRRVEP